MLIVWDAHNSLFNTPPNKVAEPPSARKRGKLREVSILFLPIYLPLFLIAGAISIPWTYVQTLRQRRQERRFEARMKASGRLMTWRELELAIVNKRGTVIGESMSTKGPFRLWWTPDDIPAVSPHRFERGHHWAWPEPEFFPFFDWCHAHYTNPKSGFARLVTSSERERRELAKNLAGVRFVSTCSFPSLRNKQMTTS